LVRYIGGGGGGNFADTMSSSQTTTKVYNNPGRIGLGAVGWGFGNGLRTEIEGSYRSNSVSGISTLRTDGLTLPLSNITGTVRTYAVMANIVYDVPFHPFGSPLQPYVGAGAGYARLNTNDVRGNGFGTFRLADGNTFGPGPDLVSFGRAGAFAYQAIAGMSLPLSILPGLQATLEYRFFGTARADVQVTRVTTTGDLVNGVLPSNNTHNG
jgi:OOP family OmpA-OmpF porin